MQILTYLVKLNSSIMYENVCPCKQRNITYFQSLWKIQCCDNLCQPYTNCYQTWSITPFIVFTYFMCVLCFVYVRLEKGQGVPCSGKNLALHGYSSPGGQEQQEKTCENLIRKKTLFVVIDQVLIICSLKVVIGDKVTFEYNNAFEKKGLQQLFQIIERQLQCSG